MDKSNGWRLRIRVVCIVGLLLVWAAKLPAQDETSKTEQITTRHQPVPSGVSQVAGWRNDGTGRFNSSGPDPSKELNEVWKTELPHRSNSSPILVANRIFVTTEPNLVCCVSAESGDLLWKKRTSYLDLQGEPQLTPRVRALVEQAEKDQLAKFDRDGLKLQHNPWPLADLAGLPDRFRRPDVHLDAGYTSPTLATDGENIFSVFGTGIVASFTLDGQRRWCAYPVKPTINWGYSSSPVLCAGKLIVHAQECVALDPQTGKELWRTQVRKRWATPCVIPDSPFVVLGGGEIIRATDGEIVEDLFPHVEECDPLVNYWGASSPVVDGSSVYFLDATPVSRERKLLPTVQRYDLIAGKDDVTGRQRWTKTLPNGKYYASPVVYDGQLHIVISTYIDKFDDYEGILNKRAKGTLLVLDADNGEPAIEKGIELGRRTGTYHTCSIAGNRLWITDHTGEYRIFDLPVVAKMRRLTLTPTRSHPLFIGNDVVLRGSDAIFRLRNK